MKARALSALLLTAAALTAGCVTPPRELPPQVTPASAAAVGLTGPAATPVAMRWWRSFGDPQFDRLIEQALQDNPGLAEAGARLRLAQAQVAAQHAALLPSANLDAGETRLKVPEDFPAALAGGQTVWAGDLGAALSWDLDLWGKQADTVRQARALEQAAALDRDDARLLLTGALTQAYIDLARGYALEDLARQAEQQRMTILQITRQRMAAGLDTRLELREAQGLLPQTRLAVAQARAIEALAVHELAALSGQGAAAYAGIGRPTLDLATVLPLPQRLPLNLLARRPDVIAARARIDAADLQHRAARAAFYPSVSLTALAGYASFSLPGLLGASAFGDGAGGSLSLPLFDAGRLRAQYRASQAGLDAAVAAYNDTVFGAVRQAADQITLIQALGDELSQQQQWSDAAEDAYRLAQLRYRAGLTDYLTTLEAETTVLEARRQHIELTAARTVARVSLLLAVGGDFQPPAPPARVAARQPAHIAARQ